MLARWTAAEGDRWAWKYLMEQYGHGISSSSWMITIRSGSPGHRRSGHRRPGRHQGSPSTCWTRNANTVSYHSRELPGLSTQWFSLGK
jgi:hypothetical protein